MAQHHGPQRRTYGKRAHHRLFQDCDYIRDSIDAGDEIFLGNAGDGTSVGAVGSSKDGGVMGLKGSSESVRTYGSRRKLSEAGAVEKRGGRSLRKVDVSGGVVEKRVVADLNKEGGGSGDGGDDNDIALKLGKLNLESCGRGEQSERKHKKEIGDECSKIVKELGTKIKSGPLAEKDGNIISASCDESGKISRKGLKRNAKVNDRKDRGAVKTVIGARGSKNGKQKEQLASASLQVNTPPKLVSPRQVRKKEVHARKYSLDGSMSPTTASRSRSTTRGSTASIKKNNDSLLVDHPESFHESTIPTNSIPPITPPFLPELTSHTTPLLALATDPSARKSPLPFSAWSDELSTYFQVIKIAEASYGEVYRLVLKTDEKKDSDERKSGRKNKRKTEGATAAAATTTIPMATGESVIKIIPLKAPAAQDSQLSPGLSTSEDPMPTSSVPAVTSEVQLLRRMAPVPGFTNFRDVRVVYGRPGKAFIDAWRVFSEEKLLPKGEESTFPDPGREFGSICGDDGKGVKRRGRRKRKEEEDWEKQERQMEKQLWAVIEMEDAGVDLEGCDVVGTAGGGFDGDCDANDGADARNDTSGGSVAESYGWGVFGVWDVFWGVASALAKGEKEASFEV